MLLISFLRILNNHTFNYYLRLLQTQNADWVTFTTQACHYEGQQVITIHVGSCVRYLISLHDTTLLINLITEWTTLLNITLSIGVPNQIINTTHTTHTTIYIVCMCVYTLSLSLTHTHTHTSHIHTDLLNVRRAPCLTTHVG